MATCFRLPWHSALARQIGRHRRDGGPRGTGPLRYRGPKDRRSPPAWARSAILVALSGCTLGPDYKAPTAADLAVPETWHAQVPHHGDVAALGQWWAQFNDPTLTSLIETAEANNPTLTEAVARLKSARAAYRQVQNAALPFVAGDAGVTQSNGNTNNLSSADLSSGAYAPANLRLATATLSASWELDLLGGGRRRTEAAEARSESTREQWHDARVSLAADVTKTYVDLRLCEALADAQLAIWTSLQRSQAYMGRKIVAGMAPPSEEWRAAALAAQAESDVQLQKTQCVSSINGLVMLTGLSFASVERRLGEGRATIPMPRDVDVAAVPADVLGQRPDLRRLERVLASSNADIGSAIADRFPKVSLTGSIGRDWYHEQGLTIRVDPWSIGPSISIPIAAALSSASVDDAKARYEQARAAYENGVRKAVREVEDALLQVQMAGRSVQVQTRVLAYARRRTDATEVEQRSGRMTRMDVESANRDGLAVLQALMEARALQAEAWVSLYRALGGGWQDGGAVRVSDGRRPAVARNDK